MSALKTHKIATHHGQGCITTACGRLGTDAQNMGRGPSFIHLWETSDPQRVVRMAASNFDKDVTCRTCLLVMKES